MSIPIIIFQGLQLQYAWALIEAAHVADAVRRMLCKRARKIIAETHELLAEARLDAADARRISR
jgi:hypothetical protein